MLRNVLSIGMMIGSLAIARADEAPAELKTIERPYPHVPDEFKRKHPQGTFYGAYKVCVEPDGHVASVETLRSIPDADDAIADQIRTTWKYEPPKARACAIEKFSFVMRKENAPDSKAPPIKPKKKSK